MVPSVYVNGLCVCVRAQVPSVLKVYSTTFLQAVHDRRVHASVRLFRLPNNVPGFDEIWYLKSELEGIGGTLFIIFSCIVIFTQYGDEIEFYGFFVNGSPYELYVGLHNIRYGCAYRLHVLYVYI